MDAMLNHGRVHDSIARLVPVRFVRREQLFRLGPGRD